MTLWEIIFLVVILKIPVAYVGSIVWWAVKAVPEVDAGAAGGAAPEQTTWTPWRRRPPRPGQRGRGPVRGPAPRAGARRARKRERSRTA